MGGDIRVASAAKFVKAKTMGGDIVINEIDGWVEATTMGGDIEVNVVGTGGDRHIELESKGGDVHLTLPADFSASFDIEIIYGKRGKDDAEIRSDFQIQTRDERNEGNWGRNLGKIFGTGSVNGGQNKVVIRTIDGEVVIKKR